MIQVDFLFSCKSGRNWLVSYSRQDTVMLSCYYQNLPNSGVTSVNTIFMQPWEGEYMDKGKPVKIDRVMWAVLLVIVISTLVIFYFEEKALEASVYEDIEERVGHKDFSIDFIERMQQGDFFENYVLVDYYNERDEVKFRGWYIWEDDTLVHKNTYKMKGK